jgi:hypothetical protein
VGELLDPVTVFKLNTYPTHHKPPGIGNHTAPPVENKTRLSAGSGVMFGESSGAKRFTVNMPAFERFVISGFPVDEFRENSDAGLKTKLKLDKFYCKKCFSIISTINN